jgi:hypothetical protein
MKPTQQLHDVCQSLWVDNIVREGVEAFAATWRELMSRIVAKSEALTKAA